MPYGWGTGGVQVTAVDPRPRRRAEGDRPGRRRHHQRRLDPPLLRQDGRRRDDHRDRARRPSSRPATASPRRRCASGQILVYQVPIPEPLRFLEPRETETRQHARAGGVRPDARQALRGHRPPRRTSPRPTPIPVKVDGRYLMDPSPIPKFDNPKMHRSPALQLFGAGREKRIYAIPPYTDVVSLDFEDHPFERDAASTSRARCAARNGRLSRRGRARRPRRAHVRLLGYRLLRARRADGHRGTMSASRQDRRCGRVAP